MKKCSHHYEISVRDGKLVCLDCGTPMRLIIQRGEDGEPNHVEVEEELVPVQARG